MAGKTWKPRECEIKFAASVTITTAGKLASFFSGGTTITAAMKEVTIQEPAYKPEKIDELGEDATGFQNADWDEKVYDVGSLKGTLVMRGDEQIESFIYGSGTAVTGGYTRYRPGDGNRLTPAILVVWADGTKEVAAVLDSAHVSIGERKQTSDGAAEYDFEAVCLPTAWYGPEYKD